MSSAESASARLGLMTIQSAEARTSAAPPARTCLDMFISPFLLIRPPCSRGSNAGRKTTGSTGAVARLVPATVYKKQTERENVRERQINLGVVDSARKRPRSRAYEISECSP